jgi:hypothetical protein
MASPLVIPGVQVKTLFEPSPVLPGATGILGVVGIADRGPIDPTPIGNMGEFLEIFGQASRFTMPEVRTALANGVSQVVVARLAPGTGAKASITLRDEEGEEVAILRARAEGLWGNQLAVRVTRVKPASGRGVKYANLEVFYAGILIETFNRLVMDEESLDYFFDRINGGSRVLVALDPEFEDARPATMVKTAFAVSPPAAATGKLKAGAGNIALAAKRTGRSGNRLGVVVRDAAGLLLLDGADAPSIDLRRRDDVAGVVTVSIIAPTLPATNSTMKVVHAGVEVSSDTFDSVDGLITKLQNNPAVVAEKRGDVIPKAVLSAPLTRRVDIDVVTEGQETRTYRAVAAAEVTSIDDPAVQFGPPAATVLPDAQAVRLGGGRGEGPALLLKAPDAAPDAPPLLEITPASETAADVSVQIVGSNAGATIDILVFRGPDQIEALTSLSMDPDDPRYLVHVLEESPNLRARDLFVRQHGDTFPADTPRPRALDHGGQPAVSDYQDALDRLEMAEEVDLVIASVANQLGDDDVKLVQMAVVAHCTRMADVARNRIGLGSISAGENKEIKKILEHVDDVRSNHFILSAPAGSEAALAGLLGLQDYFQSPTFKTIASPDTQLVPYTDAQLTQLVPANIAVVTKKRKVGTIVVKGLLTSGRQINVQRTADVAVRRVKGIADKYIGLLNNDGTRNALRQQIFAMLLQMERDGAIVPSTDGSDPAFKVDVYSTQADFANGIVRIDIAVRPVRAIDYVYATILVQN